MQYSSTMPTKKTSTKKVSKKTVKKTVKKAVKKTPKKEVRALVCAIDQECFWTRDGNILRDLRDLHVVVSSLDDEIFFHHVNKEKNDFADWVEYVLQDAECATALRKVKKKEVMHKTIERHLRNYA